MRVSTGLLAGLLVLAGGCAARGPSLPGSAPPGFPGLDDRAAGVLRTALALRGAPYRDGGSDPRGFDCSGFVQYVFAQHGESLARQVTELARAGRTVRRREIQPADLLFFATNSRGASHVAIAVDSDAFIHAPSSGGAVRFERLSAPYWSRRFLGARRVLR